MTLQITSVLCRSGSMNNYSYILLDKDSSQSAIIDPSEAAPIIKSCTELNIKPDYIFNTHHHFDHTDANLEIKQRYGCQIVGAAADKHRIPGIDIEITPESTFALGSSKAEIIDAPGHTHGHILWYFPSEKVLFTGDVLFNLCIGGLFEGTPDEMFMTLQRIKKLPDDTLFYPGHEYTLSGLDAALYYNGNKPEMQEYLQLIKEKAAQNLSISPVSLRLEKACNPYLRATTATELFVS